MRIMGALYSGVYAIEYWVSTIDAKQAPYLHLDTLKVTSMRLCTIANILRDQLSGRLSILNQP